MKNIRKLLNLYPYPLPDSNIVDDNIEKKEIPSHSSKECNKECIDDLLPLALGAIQCTDPLTTKVPYEPDGKTEKSERSEVPLIPSVKGICQ